MVRPITNSYMPQQIVVCGGIVFDPFPDMLSSGQRRTHPGNFLRIVQVDDSGLHDGQYNIARTVV